MHGSVAARLRSMVPSRLRWREFRSEAARLMRAGNFEDADRMLARGLAAFPDHPELMTDYALSAHDSGRHVLAVERWDDAMRVAPHKPVCHAGLAANLRALGQLARARDVVEHSLRRFPSHVAVVAEAARLAASEGRLEEAAKYWARATSRSQPRPDWLQGHAQCLALLGRFDEAQEVLAAALKRFPNHRGLCAVEGMLTAEPED